MKLYKDLPVGCVFIAAAIVLFILTFGFDEVPPAFAQGMQAAEMPQLLLICIIFLSGLMIYQGWQKPESEREAVPKQVWSTSAVLIIAAALVESLGISIIVFCSSIAIPMLWGERFRKGLLIYALSGPIVIFVIFTLALKLRLPQGPLSSLLY